MRSHTKYLFGTCTVTFFVSFCKHPDEETKESKHVAYCIVCLVAVYKFINDSGARENEGSSFDNNYIYFRQELNSDYTLLSDNIYTHIYTYIIRNWLTHSDGTNRRKTTTVYPALAVRIIHDFPELILGRVNRCFLQVSSSTVYTNWEVCENNRP